MHLVVPTAVLLAISIVANADEGSSVAAAAAAPAASIFPPFISYDAWAICKGIVTKAKFPKLQAPTNAGGCVRYFRGIDITGVVTEKHFFFKDGVKTACDCAIKCLQRPGSCTNWVWKFAFIAGDANKRSCTLYSSPNLPSSVTLGYNLAKSKGFQLLQAANNPQAGGGAPLTFLDKASKHPDVDGVSGFIVQDAVKRQFC